MAERKKATKGASGKSKRDTAAAKNGDGDGVAEFTA